MGMAGRDIVADVGNIASPVASAPISTPCSLRLNPARGAHDKTVFVRAKAKPKEVPPGAGSRSPAVIDMPSERGVDVPPPQVACA